MKLCLVLDIAVFISRENAKFVEPVPAGAKDFQPACAEARPYRIDAGLADGGVFRVKGSRFWWISYQLNGKTVRESSGELTKTGAANKLKERLLAIGNGNFLAPRIAKITVDELYEDLLQDYRIKNQTVEWAERLWNVHLKDYFSGMRASNVGTTQITGYVEKRLAESAARSTINRELALLRRAFSIGFDAEPQKVVRVPKSTSFQKRATSAGDLSRSSNIESSRPKPPASYGSGDCLPWPTHTGFANRNCSRCAVRK